jgi:ATP-dependent Clp protease ATP-binding subunit ClpC
MKVKNPYDKKILLALNTTSKRVLNSSQLECDKLGDDEIGEEHLMLSILRDKEIDCVKVLNNQNIDYKIFKDKLVQIKKQINMSMTDDFEEIGGSKIKKNNGKSTTPILDNFGRDITEIAAKGGIDPIIGRDEEVERVAQILSRRKKNNPILIGEPGCVLADTKIVVKKISDLSTHTFIDK